MTKRTIIYIDGYNLYYSRLKGTAFKWLDIARLFRDLILKQQDPSAEVVAIKYFTAPVMASYARHGTASEQAQMQYLRALQAKVISCEKYTHLTCLFVHLLRCKNGCIARYTPIFTPCS